MSKSSRQPPSQPTHHQHNPPSFAQELCEGGALLERVESRAYSERYIAGLARSILRFIAQCHARGIVYRDVKPGARGGPAAAGSAPVCAVPVAGGLRWLCTMCMAGERVAQITFRVLSKDGAPQCPTPKGRNQVCPASPPAHLTA